MELARRRFTIDDYLEMGEAGIFRRGERYAKRHGKLKRSG